MFGVAQTERVDAQKMFAESKGDVATSYAINPKLNSSHYKTSTKCPEHQQRHSKNVEVYAKGLLLLCRSLGTPTFHEILSEMTIWLIAQRWQTNNTRWWTLHLYAK